MLLNSFKQKNEQRKNNTLSNIFAELCLSNCQTIESFMMLSSAQKIQSNAFADMLKSIDWSFVHREKSHSIESIHPYPAKFISNIPRAFLETLPMPKGTAVLDPFCGSGPTLTESQRFNLPSIGIDLNPIACLISRVKTTDTPHDFERIVSEVVDHAHSYKNSVQWNIPNVDHWFEKEAQEAIIALVQAIQAYSSNQSFDALRLALSSILVRISKQESDTRYAAIDKKVTKTDVFNAFLVACKKLHRALLSRDWPLSSIPYVIEGDILTINPKTIPLPVGIIITSPPYPNAYEYWLYHKYRMWWLGFDPIAVKTREIGARAHFFKRNHHTEDDFLNQMRTTFNLIDAVLVPSGFVCFVVGRSKIHGKIINNADIIQSVADERGMDLITRLERVIAANRKSFNLSHANIKTETVIVFQKR